MIVNMQPVCFEMVGCLSLNMCLHSNNPEIKSLCSLLLRVNRCKRVNTAWVHWVLNAGCTEDFILGENV